MKKWTSFYQGPGHANFIRRDLTPDFTSANHTFRYNAYHAHPSVKPAGIHELIFTLVAFVLGLLTLTLFLSGSHDGILFWLSIFFPVSAITALLKR